ncbi:hypothetical protein SDC9_87083 [bioreactor metagenome]|uniref:Uncharacterized protein n=1 Tax=bioreactor metagenome TaxID=1076179 RepID=A0A644ZHR6_9ZZZZ
MQAFACFGELIGQRRGDAVGSLEDRQRIQLVHVADHEGHGHGLAQRAAQAQHHATEHASLGVGQHHFPDHFPGSGTQAVGRFLEQRGRHFKHVAHHRGDERDDHDGQDDAGRKNTDTHRRAGHQRAQIRHAAQQLLQRLLHISGQDGAEHHQTPHAVDDGGHGGQQLNGRAQRALEPCGREFGKK